MQCVKCDETINPKRAALGYNTCIDCGSSKSEVIAQYSKRVMPLNNKGNIGLITGRTVSEQKAQVLGRTGKGIHT